MLKAWTKYCQKSIKAVSLQKAHSQYRIFRQGFGNLEIISGEQFNPNGTAFLSRDDPS
jgi:hypothetical protein